MGRGNIWSSDRNTNYSNNEILGYTTVHTFLGYYRKFIMNFSNMTKPLTLLTHQQAKFNWTPTHHTTFLIPKESVIQSPILCYLDKTKSYIVYTDASNDILWSITLTGTQCNRIPNSFSFTYLHRHTTQMEHDRTRSLWCILHIHKM